MMQVFYGIKAAPANRSTSLKFDLRGINPRFAGEAGQRKALERPCRPFKTSSPSPISPIFEQETERQKFV